MPRLGQFVTCPGAASERGGKTYREFKQGFGFPPDRTPSYGRPMTDSTTRYVLWVKREDAELLSDEVLRERAGLEGSGVEVRTEALSGWRIAVVPAGSREESGAEFSEPLNVGVNELPPEGRVDAIRTG